MPSPWSTSKVSRERHGILNGYRSGLEDQVSSDLTSRNIGFLYEQAKLSYTIPARDARYTPDFIVRRDMKPVTHDFKSNPNWFEDPEFWRDHFCIESKGRWMPDDRKKHELIAKQYPSADIKFLFTRSKTPIRKGSKTTYADVCVKNGFDYADRVVPLEWFNREI